jgi:hypothetical protein
MHDAASQKSRQNATVGEGVADLRPVVAPPGIKSAHDLRWSVTVDGNPGQDARALPGETGGLDCSSEGLDAVSQTDQSGSTVGIGATDAVVADRHLGDRILDIEPDVHC